MLFSTSLAISFSKCISKLFSLLTLIFLIV